MTRDLFVTGTDTGVGKTVLSALLVASLKRRYWKPIQTGAAEGTDRAAVVDWAGVSIEETHAEAFVFDSPVSPHLAAQLQGRGSTWSRFAGLRILMRSLLRERVVYWYPSMKIQ